MNTSRVRIIVIQVIITLLGAVIIGRLFLIQVVQGKEYALKSKNQTQQRMFITARRGDIRDRKGRILATTVSRKINMTDLVDSLLEKGIAINDSSAIASYTNIRRMYPYGELAGPVLGYTGRDHYGLDGAECSFERQLRGEDGWVILQRDGRNRMYRKIGLPMQLPRDGATVYLTIDVDIQEIVQNVLRQTVTDLNAKSAMAIVMDPKNGRILAMANEPTFDPNIPSRYSLDQRRNSCIGFNFEPGSTFKVITASTALEEKVKKEDDIIFGNNGSYEVFNEIIHDEKPFGYLSFAQALTFSSNVCFAKIANDIGNEKLYRYTRDFGLGTRSGIDLPGEESGIVHPINKWSGRTRVTMAIGQEVLATLLQMMNAFAVVANGGVLLTSHIHDKVVRSDGAVVDSAVYEPVRRVISEETARRMRRMMHAVVDDGTGGKAAMKGVQVGGKTGTSQKFDKTTGTMSKDLGWASFIGFTPVESPVLLCGVVVDEPVGKNSHGGLAAAPAFKKIIEQIIGHPQLEFAEQILHERPDTSAGNRPKIVGDFCKMGLKKACLSARKAGFLYIIKGNGDSVNAQSPAPGSTISRMQSMVFYTQKPACPPVPASALLVAMPDCQGKDLRDAISSVNRKGLKPYIAGSGKVIRQWPPAGCSLTAAMVCTLTCSFTPPIMSVLSFKQDAALKQKTVSLSDSLTKTRYKKRI